MSESNAKFSPGAVGLAFLGGALIGTGLALLLAPMSGRETREKIKNLAQRAEDEIAAKVKDLKQTMESCKQACEEQVKSLRG
jgi:gas vesicle protein